MAEVRFLARRVGPQRRDGPALRGRRDHDLCGGRPVPVIAFNGTIGYSAMTSALARGYATSSTDKGHTGGGASWALGHPEKVIDFGWRAMHETATASKAIIEAYYGGAPKFSYFNGCSAGGRQAMKAAQRFPADFNGIIAGAPGLDWTGRAAGAVRIAKRLEQNEAARLGQAQR